MGFSAAWQAERPCGPRAALTLPREPRPAGWPVRGQLCSLGGGCEQPRRSRSSRLSSPPPRCPCSLQGPRGGRGVPSGAEIGAPSVSCRGARTAQVIALVAAWTASRRAQVTASAKGGFPLDATSLERSLPADSSCLPVLSSLKSLGHWRLALDEMRGRTLDAPTWGSLPPSRRPRRGGGAGSLEEGASDWRVISAPLWSGAISGPAGVCRLAHPGTRAAGLRL